MGELKLKSTPVKSKPHHNSVDSRKIIGLVKFPPNKGVIEYSTLPLSNITTEKTQIYLPLHVIPILPLHLHTNTKTADLKQKNKVPENYIKNSLKPQNRNLMFE